LRTEGQVADLSCRWQTLDTQRGLFQFNSGSSKYHLRLPTQNQNNGSLKTHPILHSSTLALNDNRLTSLFVQWAILAYPLDNPSDSSQCSWMSWYPALGYWVALKKFGDWR